MATDETAEAFVERVRSRLVGSLVLFCGDAAVGEELAHEALIRVWQKWSVVQASASPEAWAYSAAFNLARSWGRRRAAERRALRRLAAGATPVDLPDQADALAVRRAVQDLPRRQREVVVARFYAGLDVAATAAALGCAEGTVRAHTHRALQRLRSAGLIDSTEVEADA